MREVNVAVKKCSKCGEEKPATTDFFYKEKKGVLGLHSWCKECVKALARKNHFEHRPRNLARMKKRWQENPELVRARNRAYYLANRDKALAVAKEKAKQPGFRERRRKYENDWYHDNVQRALDYWHKRRALKAVGGSHTEKEVSDLLQKQKGRCVACCSVLGKTFHRDHIVPLKLGGDNSIRNIQLLCPQCNSKKGAKIPEVFMRENGYLL
jgi:5-methylcytosine-specific restriction endonuclease McrA